MFDAGKPTFVPTRGKPNVIMFVGSQCNGFSMRVAVDLRFLIVTSADFSLGFLVFNLMSGSDTTDLCSKYAHYHQKRGWKPAIVSTNTFGTRAFAQLKQYATKANIPFYGR